MEAVQLRQQLIQHALSKPSNTTNSNTSSSNNSYFRQQVLQELPEVTFKAGISNLLISRDLDSLRVKVADVSDEELQGVNVNSAAYVNIPTSTPASYFLLKESTTA